MKSLSTSRECARRRTQLRKREMIIIIVIIIVVIIIITITVTTMGLTTPTDVFKNNPSTPTVVRPPLRPGEK